MLHSVIVVPDWKRLNTGAATLVNAFLTVKGGDGKPEEGEDDIAGSAAMPGDKSPSGSRGWGNPPESVDKSDPVQPGRNCKEGRRCALRFLGRAAECARVANAKIGSRTD